MQTDIIHFLGGDGQDDPKEILSLYKKIKMDMI